MLSQLDRFEVTFDKEPAVYEAGEVVNGALSIELGRSLTVTRVGLHFSGLAYVRFDDPGHTQVFQQSEVYLDKSRTVFPDYDNFTHITFDAGSHLYPFQFTLPASAPNSFEGDYGNIRYSVKGIIELPRGPTKELTTKRYFSVIGTYDLNGNMQASRPIEDRRVQGDVEMTTIVPKTGFVAGETIECMANIHNRSGRRTTRVHAALVQLVTYSGKLDKNAKTHSIKDVMKEVEDICQIPAKHDATHKASPLRIPSIPPQILNCTIIRVQYVLRLILMREGGFRTVPDLVIETPLIIGTVPLPIKSGVIQKIANEQGQSIDPKHDTHIVTIRDDIQVAKNADLGIRAYKASCRGDAKFTFDAIEHTNAHHVEPFRPLHVFYKRP